MKRSKSLLKRPFRIYCIHHKPPHAPTLKSTSEPRETQRQEAGGEGETGRQPPDDWLIYWPLMRNQSRCRSPLRWWISNRLITDQIRSDTYQLSSTSSGCTQDAISLAWAWAKLGYKMLFLNVEFWTSNLPQDQVFRINLSGHNVALNRWPGRVGLKFVVVLVRKMNTTPGDKR